MGSQFLRDWNLEFSKVHRFDRFESFEFVSIHHVPELAHIENSNCHKFNLSCSELSKLRELCSDRTLELRVFQAFNWRIRFFNLSTFKTARTRKFRSFKLPNSQTFESSISGKLQPFTPSNSSLEGTPSAPASSISRPSHITRRPGVKHSTRIPVQTCKLLSRTCIRCRTIQSFKL